MHHIEIHRLVNDSLLAQAEKCIEEAKTIFAFPQLGVVGSASEKKQEFIWNNVDIDWIDRKKSIL